jgi:hypothetical protein
VEIREVHVVSGADWVDAAEICRLCRLDLDAVIEFAELGLVSLRGDPPDQWQLPVAALPRLALAGRLMRDLGVNVSGAALALELLDARHELERQIRRLQALVQ